MTAVQTNELTAHKALRLWPGVVAAVLLVLIRYGLPLVLPDAVMVAFFGELGGGLVILVWRLFFSRAAWSERLGAPILMVLALFGTSRLVHESIRGGMMGMMLAFYAIPVLSLALVAWAVATRRLSDGLRRVSLLGT